MEKGPPGSQHAVIMRHGRRHDSEMPAWSLRAQHPWDTPLSARGVKEIQSIASGLLEQLKFELVVVSPFLRCLQTAHHLLKVWDPVKPVRVVVDRQVSELYSPELLHLSASPGCFPVTKRWFWQRGWRTRAHEWLGCLPNVTLEFSEKTNWPEYPEQKAKAGRRFNHAVDVCAGWCKGNVLLVTHGDAVLAAAKRLEPTSYVDNVQPGGYVVALRDVVPDVGLWQTDPCIPWSGVSWARRAHDDDCIYK